MEREGIEEEIVTGRKYKKKYNEQEMEEAYNEGHETRRKYDQKEM